MKKLTMAVAVGLWVIGAATGFAGSPHLGTWKLDEAKSDIPAGMPKNTTVVYSTEAGDKWKVTTEGKDKEGKATKTTWVGKVDGQPYAVEGSQIYDQVAYTKKDEHTNEMKFMKGGKVVGTGTITVAADGKSRLVMANVTGEDGKEMKSKAAYTKE